MKKSILNLEFYTEKENVQGGFLKMLDEPHIIGKIIKIRDNDSARHFDRRTGPKYKARVEGYNIFIMHDGFEYQPHQSIPDKWIKVAIDDMCRWFYENKIEKNKGFQDMFKTKSI